MTGFGAVDDPGTAGARAGVAAAPVEPAALDGTSGGNGGKDASAAGVSAGSFDVAAVGDNSEGSCPPDFAGVGATAVGVADTVGKPDGACAAEDAGTGAGVAAATGAGVAAAVGAGAFGDVAVDGICAVAVGAAAAVTGVGAGAAAVGVGVAPTEGSGAPVPAAFGAVAVGAILAVGATGAGDTAAGATGTTFDPGGVANDGSGAPEEARPAATGGAELGAGARAVAGPVVAAAVAAATVAGVRDGNFADDAAVAPVVPCTPAVFNFALSFDGSMISPLGLSLSCQNIKFSTKLSSWVSPPPDSSCRVRRIFGSTVVAPARASSAFSPAVPVG